MSVPLTLPEAKTRGDIERTAVELTPQVWRTLFADTPLRSNLDRARDPPTA